MNADGSVKFGTFAGGTATRGNLTLDAPNVIATGGLNAVVLNVTGGPTLFTTGTNNYVSMQSGQSGGWTWRWATGTGVLEWLNDLGVPLLQFGTGGDAGKAAGGTAWYVISDVRAKTDIEDWNGGLDKVLSLRPRRFTRIDTGERSIGCVADEAETGFAELIHRAPGKVGDTEYPDLATLHIDPLFWALVNSIKTLHERIATLEAALAAK